MEPMDDDFYDGPSRSQQRRDALEVLDLAKLLVALSDAELGQVPMSDELRELVVESRRITAHIARKRQMQYLAKHLRRAEDELPAIRAAIERDKMESRRETAKLHRVEAWRDRLIAGGDDALNAFIAEHPDADRQHLRALSRRAVDEHRGNKPPAAARELFRSLRELMVIEAAAAELDAESAEADDGDRLEADDLADFDFDPGERERD